MRKLIITISVLFLLIFADSAFAQKQQWVFGGRFGLAILSFEGGSATGLQIGPMAEMKLNRNMGVGTEFNINTQSGTPIEWANYFKYYFDIPGSNVKPYANAGFSLWIFTGGPYFSIRFGGGANFKVAPKIYIPADLQLGPVFASGTSVFYFAITSGIRYEL